MKKSISVERLYTLGDYKNIKFGEIINDIPEELFKNTEIMNEIKFLQMLDLELSYRNYLLLAEKLVGIDLSEAIKVIEDLQVNTIEKLNELVNNTNTEEEKGE